jgi:hypothetical protein
MGYNKGDSYEEKIFDILNAKNLIVVGSSRGGAGNKADIEFLHNGLPNNNLEVKLNLKADFGQKMLEWENGIWSWSNNDSITDIYTSAGVLDVIKAKNFIPNRYSVPKHNITLAQKKQDFKAFKDYLQTSVDTLYDFYANKQCYYIQIGGYGFYHLKNDILGLGTPQFTCTIKLRLRCKTKSLHIKIFDKHTKVHIKKPIIYNYFFWAVLQVDTTVKIQKSCFDIEEKDGRKFPPII